MIFARVIFVAGILLLTGVAQECPDPTTSIFGGACVEACSSDSDCTNGQLCCSNGCGHECMVSTTVPPNTTTDTTLLPTSSPMMCPNTNGLIGTCDEQCSSDDECSDGQLCCSNGCGHACMDSVLDCSSVTCLRPDCDPPGVLFIPTGSCCPICAIPDTAYTPETTEVPTDNLFHTCPTLEGNDDNDCVAVDNDQCSSNDDCQYERICCSDGCGGRVCSDPVELCQVVDCAWPGAICEDGTQPDISPFRCCPFCLSEEGITDNDGGTGVITMATLTMVTLCCFLTFLF